MFDRVLFLRQVQGTLFDGLVQPMQLAGINRIIDFWIKEAAQPRDLRQLAYILATVFHETGATMQPIKEKGGKAYLLANYDVSGSNPARARANGNTAIGDGALYAGRGYVQLTWKNNYRRVGSLIGVDLVSNPALAQKPTIATAILVHGMEQGWFTGRKLGEFFDASHAEWIQARRIVNGIDKAAFIAGHARRFLAAMKDTAAPQETAREKVPADGSTAKKAVRIKPSAGQQSG